MSGLTSGAIGLVVLFAAYVAAMWAHFEARRGSARLTGHKLRARAAMDVEDTDSSSVKSVDRGAPRAVGDLRR
jgi:hypothetical protein